MRIFVFSAALALTNVQLAAAADNEIVFAPKNFSDLGEYVGVSGTLSGADVANKNNTYAIACIKDRQECLVTYIEQIGPHPHYGIGPAGRSATSKSRRSSSIASVMLTARCAATTRYFGSLTCRTGTGWTSAPTCGATFAGRLAGSIPARTGAMQSTSQSLVQDGELVAPLPRSNPDA